MREFYIVIDQDNDRKLVYNPTQHTDLLDMIAKMHPCPKWTIEREDYRIIIYLIALYHMPVGDNREEMEQRILAALDLI